MNESKMYRQEGYWNYQNIGVCYTDMLQDLADRCSKRSLPNYFNHEENMLANKDRNALEELKGFALKRRSNLMHLRLTN